MLIKEFLKDIKRECIKEIKIEEIRKGNPTARFPREKTKEENIRLPKTR